MAEIGNIPEIIEVKQCLEQMKSEGVILQWELPYENLLTRRSAAVFFLTPVSQDDMLSIEKQLKQYKDFSCRENTEKTLSQLSYRVEFIAKEA